LRNASKRNPEFVLDLCKKWVLLKNPNTNWIIKEGLRKLKESHPKEVEEILNLLSK
jgi:3-methyladenine DNA glycosylase AlkC